MTNLLIIDDEEEVRTGLLSMIDWSSYKIHADTAANGKEAISKINEHIPDLILLDIEMPKMDGLTFMEYLKERNIKIPCIILSGHDEFSYAQKAIDLNVFSYLLKPCYPQDILNKVLELKEYIHFIDPPNQSIETVKGSSMDSLSITHVGKNKKSHGIIDLCVTYIEEHFHEPIKLENLSNYVYLSPAYLSFLFKQVMEISFVDYLHQVRIKKACQLLANWRYKSYEIAQMVGYDNEKYFATKFKKYKGMTPTQYRKSIS